MTRQGALVIGRPLLFVLVCALHQFSSRSKNVVMMSRDVANPLLELAKPLLAAVALAIVFFAGVPVLLADEAPPVGASGAQGQAEVKNESDADPSQTGAPAVSAEAAKTGDTGSDTDEKFNPLLIRNNPKAHAYALSLRPPVIVELGLANRSVEITLEEFKSLTEKAQDVLFELAADYAVRNGKLNNGQFYVPPVDYGHGEDVVAPLMSRVR